VRGVAYLSRKFIQDVIDSLSPSRYELTCSAFDSMETLSGYFMHQ